MILLESLSPSYEYFMTTLKTMQMKEFTMEYVMTRLMHEVSKKKEKGPTNNNVVIVLYQDKTAIHLGTKMSICSTFVANRATLLIFGMKQKISKLK